jgi:chromosome partitioning protein
MRRIVVANQKGGVAKTTTTINLGHALSQLGHKVLIVDMDPQGHVGEGFGIPTNELDQNVSMVLEGESSIKEAIYNVRPNLDLVPSNIYLSSVEAKLFLKTRREDKLKQALGTLNGEYDITLIDCPPSLGLLTVNALSAANDVLIPMTTEFYSMLGVGLLLQTIEDMRVELNPELQILGILPTKSNRTIHSKEVIYRTRRELKDQVRVFDIVIKDSVRFREASAMGQSILEYAPAHEGAIAYRRLAREICN